MVRDQRRDLPAADQLADVLDLRLGEGARPAVRRVGEQVRGSGPAPEPAVVAVQVHARAVAAGARRREGAGAVRGVLAVDDTAVLPLVGVAGGRQHRGGAAERVGLVEVAEVEQCSVGAREVEAVDVHHGDHDDAGPVEQSRDPRVGAVVLDEVVGELHRQLARGPLAGVVHTEQRERRAPVLGGLHVAADLDAVDGSAVERLVRQRDPLGDRRPEGGEVADVVVVVGQRAVGVPTRGQRRLQGRRRVGLVGGVDLGRATGHVGDPDVEAETRVAQQSQVGQVVQHHLDVVVPGVLGEVQAQGLEQRLVRAGGCVDGDQLGGEDGVAGLGGAGRDPGGQTEQGEGGGGGDDRGAGGTGTAGHGRS